MSLDNHKHLSADDTDRFLIFLQTHLINIDLMTNKNFRESQKLSPEKAFDHVCHLNNTFYKEFEHLFIFTKKQMLKFVYKQAGIDVPETLYKKKKRF
jgi:hypothetical protein